MKPLFGLDVAKATNIESRMVSRGARTLLLTLLIFAVPATANATPDRPLDGWVTDGTVRAMQRAGDTLYLGGDFTRIGPATGRGVALDPFSGAPDMAWPKIDGSIETAIPDGEGGLYIAGQFHRVGGLRREQLAHVDADGNVTSFSPSVVGTVRSLLLSGNTLYVGGGFGSINGTTRNKLAAIDVVSGELLPWNPDVSGIEVHDMALSGSLTLIAGGQFVSVGGSPRANLAAIDRNTGVASAWNPGTDGPVRALEPTPGTSTLYVGGSFSTLAGSPRDDLGTVSLATGAAGTFVASIAGAGSTVYDLALVSRTLYVAGDFTSVGGQSRSHLAAVDTIGSTPTAWAPNPSARVNSIAASGSRVVAGGVFTSVGGGTPRNRLAAFDASSGLPTSWNPDANGTVVTVAVTGAKIFAGGDLNSVGGVQRSRLAAIDTSTGMPTAFNPPTLNGGVHALAVEGSTVYAGGTFTGFSANRLAAFDATTGAQDTSFAVGADNSVLGLASSPTRLTWAARSRSSTAPRGTAWPRWTSPRRRWIRRGRRPSPAWCRRSSAATPRSTSGGRSPRSTAPPARVWPPSTLERRPALVDPAPNNAVWSILVDGSTVYVGGDFTSIGGQSRGRIAAIGSASGLALAFDPNADGSVRAIAKDGPTVYLGGLFTTLDGNSRIGLGAVEAPSGALTGWSPQPDDAVHALVATGSTLHVGGQFEAVAGTSRPNFATFGTAAPVNIDRPDLSGQALVGQSLGCSTASGTGRRAATPAPGCATARRSAVRPTRPTR